MSYCRGCNREIVWGTTEDGKKIPLDPRAPVYVSIRQDASGDLLIKRTSMSMVSHFATCSAANRFSGSNKAKAPA